VGLICTDAWEGDLLDLIAEKPLRFKGENEDVPSVFDDFNFTRLYAGDSIGEKGTGLSVPPL